MFVVNLQTRLLCQTNDANKTLNVKWYVQLYGNFLKLIYYSTRVYYSENKHQRIAKLNHVVYSVSCCLPGLLLLTHLTEIGSCICNCILLFEYDVITHPCPSISEGKETPDNITICHQCDNVFYHLFYLLLTRRKWYHIVYDTKIWLSFYNLGFSFHTKLFMTN